MSVVSVPDPSYSASEMNVLKATQAQLLASDPTSHVWVSASAGTGKTKVLVERFLRLLLTGETPERILCLTYTKAAAAEMQTRLQKALASWVTLSENDLRGELAALGHPSPSPAVYQRARTLFAVVLDVPGGLNIMTLHGFCQSVLKRFPLEAGLAPHFEVLDEQTAKGLMHLAFYEAVGSPDPLVQKALSHLAAARAETTLQDILKDLMTHRAKLTAMLRAHEAAGPDPALTKWLAQFGGGAALDKAALEADFCAKKPDLRAVMQSLAEETGKIASKWADTIQKQADTPDLEIYLGAFLTLKGEPDKRMPPKKWAEANPDLADIYRKEADRCADFWQARLAAAFREEQTALWTVGEAVMTRYQAHKTARAALDYEDLILATEALLARPDFAAWVLFKLDGGISHVLVDEAQDTSPAQWRILERLTDGFFDTFVEGDSSDGAPLKTVFVVGDFKQSIYSFQGAAPHLFQRMEQAFRGKAETSGQPFRRIEMQVSFRSTPPVLQAVDAVIQQDCFDIETAAEVPPHLPKRASQGGTVTVWPLMKPEKAAVAEATAETPWRFPEPREAVASPVEQTAAQIAATIAGWLEGQRVLASTQQPVRPGDILILIRKRTRIVEALIKRLSLAGIPVAGADRLALKDHIGVQDMLAVCRFLSLPTDDLTLACVLKSPLFGMSEEALFEVCYDRGEASLWQRVQDTAPEIAATLSAWLARAEEMAPFELLSSILVVDGGWHKMRTRLGQGCVEPLEELLTLAQDYPSQEPPTLQGFLAWMEDTDIVLKREQDSGSQAVRIMTVHGAKGLQAPVVFVADGGKGPTQKDLPSFLWEEDAQLVLQSASQETAPAPLKALREEAYQHLWAEYHRLLYVALTRAEEELIVAGWQDGSGAPDPASWPVMCHAAVAALGREDDNGAAVLHRPGEADRLPKTTSPENEAHEGGASLEALPVWAHQTVPGAQDVKTVTASKRFEGPQAADEGLPDGAAYGTVFHQIAEALKTGSEDEVAGVLASLHQVPAAHRARLETELMALLNDKSLRAVLFGGEIACEVSCEVPVMAAWGDQVFHGKIDRLVVTDKTVTIVDFKTDRVVPKDLSAYEAQLVAYARAVAAVYPAHDIKAGLMWTAQTRWQEVAVKGLENDAQTITYRSKK